jgi:hypothetical protein
MYMESQGRGLLYSLSFHPLDKTKPRRWHIETPLQIVVRLNLPLPPFHRSSQAM